MSANTLFLRLEGPLQAWGDQQSKFVIRRTAEAPTKSGVIGMLCAALGVSRPEAAEKLASQARRPAHGRAHRPARRPLVGLSHGGRGNADAHCRRRGSQTRRDAHPARISLRCLFSRRPAGRTGPDCRTGGRHESARMDALPRQKVLPSVPPVAGEHPPGDFPDLLSALKSVPWRQRLKKDQPPGNRGLPAGLGADR